MVAATIFCSWLATSGEKLPVLKYHLRMDLKMVCIVLSSKLAKATMLKCLWNLGVMNDLPPPGVPMEQTNIVSTMFLNGCLASLLSYQPPASRNCLRISIGG